MITQHFGVNPQYYAQFGLPGHEGIDFRAPHGSMIFACADGTVYRVETADNNNYGIHVRIEHADGYKTVYAHLMKPLVMVGDIVRAGEVIGLADNTGNSHGDHLHLTLKLGERILDPTPFLLPFGVDKTGQFGRFWLATGRPRELRGPRWDTAVLSHRNGLPSGSHVVHRRLTVGQGEGRANDRRASARSGGGPAG